MKRMTLSAALVLLLLGAGKWVASTMPAAAEPTPPATWLAFTAVYGGFTSPENAFLGKSPSVLVKADGTIIWSDPKKLYQYQRTETGTWQTGKLDARDLEKLKKLARDLNFFAIAPTPPPAPEPGKLITRTMLADAATTAVGFQFDGSKRIVRVYALGHSHGDQSGTDAYSTAMKALRDELHQLKPATSQPYVPDSIKVVAFRAYGKIEETGTWPLAESPDLQGKLQNYSGADATAVRDALSKNALIKFGDAVYHVVWLPSLDVPVGE